MGLTRAGSASSDPEVNREHPDPMVTAACRRRRAPERGRGTREAVSALRRDREGAGRERNNKKQCLLCFMSMLLSLGSRKDFKQISSPLGWQTALAANFRP